MKRAALIIPILAISLLLITGIEGCNLPNPSQNQDTSALCAIENNNMAIDSASYYDTYNHVLNIKINRLSASTGYFSGIELHFTDVNGDQHSEQLAELPDINYYKVYRINWDSQISSVTIAPIIYVDGTYTVCTYQPNINVMTISPTCAEIGGIVCNPGESCRAPMITTSDTNYCCTYPPCNSA